MKAAPSKTSGGKAKWFAPVREDEIMAEEDNGGSSNGGSNGGEDDEAGEDTSSENTGDVIVSIDQQLSDVVRHNPTDGPEKGEQREAQGKGYEGTGGKAQ